MSGTENRLQPKVHEVTEQEIFTTLPPERTLLKIATKSNKTTIEQQKRIIKDILCRVGA